jgi:hypothetical protein
MVTITVKTLGVNGAIRFSTVLLMEHTVSNGITFNKELTSIQSDYEHLADAEHKALSQAMVAIIALKFMNIECELINRCTLASI